MNDERNSTDPPRQKSEMLEYQWQLTKALLIRMNEEAESLYAKLIIVGIP